ncbi:MAG: DNA polymerase IV [Methanosarcinaceae archaeon]|nr:DNA polymerase IV [Methanosarcinaceae archaeon]
MNTFTILGTSAKSVPSKTRIILHVDMDSFYSSVEVRDNSQLKGQPVVVGSDPKNGAGRGVVSTCSYEAREFGIRSGMPVSKAYKLCPDAVFLPVNMSLYKEVSKQIMEILREFTDRFQQVSVDEAYLDVSMQVGDHAAASKFAQNIKDEILLREGITCSIGVAPNKLVAKIASDFQKPDGLTVVKPEDVVDFLTPLPVSRIPGIGKKTADILKSMDVETIWDLAAYDVQLLLERFGKFGIKMHQMARGIDKAEVEERGDVKSISNEDTFDEDTADPFVIGQVLDSLAKSVHVSLMKNKFLFKTITLKVRFEDFSTYTRARSLRVYGSDIDLIKVTVKDLMREFMGKGKFRLLGVGVSNFEKVDGKQKLITDFL